MTSAWSRIGASRLRLAGIALLAILLAIRSALPLAVEWAAERAGSESLGRRVRIGDVDLSVLTGAVVIERLGVGPLGAIGAPPPEFAEAEAHFQLDRGEIRWEWLPLLRGEIRIGLVDLEGPRGSLFRSLDGNLIQILRPQPGRESEPQEEIDPGSEPWPVHLDQLRVGNFRLLYVNLAIPEQIPIQLELEEFTLDELSVVGNDIGLRAAGVHGPSLRIRRDIDLAVLQAAAEQDTGALESEVAEPTPAYRLAELELDRARFTIVTDDDEEIETRLTLSARDVTGIRETSFPVKALLEIGGGSLSIDAQVGIAPITFEGTISWTDLPLDVLASIEADATPFHVDSGSSSGDLEVRAILAGLPDDLPTKIDIAGRIGVTDFDAASGEDLSVAFRSLELVADQVVLRPEAPAGNRVDLARVRLLDPAVALRVAPAPAGGGVDAAPDGAAGGTPPPSVHVASLEITGGSARIEDRTVEPAYRSELSELSVRASGLRFPEGDADDLVVRAKGPGRGASVAIDARITQGNGQARVVVSDLGLRALSPYVARGAGYRLTRGQTSVDAAIAASAGVVDIESSVELDKIAIQEVNPGTFQDTFGMPINTAIALLRDGNGVITLPVSTRLEDGRSDIEVRQIVRGALQQAIVAALSAPLKAAGMLKSVSGGGRFGLSGLEVPPGALPRIRADDLSGIGELLGSRAEIAIALRGRAGKADDSALQRQQLGDQAAANADLPPVDAGFFQKRRLLDFLRQQGSNEDADLSEEDAVVLERWAEAIEVTREHRDRLAIARAEAVREALLADFELHPDRVVIGEPLDGKPGVELDLLPYEP
jgi:hypothetical protein